MRVAFVEDDATLIPADQTPKPAEAPAPEAPVPKKEPPTAPVPADAQALPQSVKPVPADGDIGVPPSATIPTAVKAAAAPNSNDVNGNTAPLATNSVARDVAQNTQPVANGADSAAPSTAAGNEQGSLLPDSNELLRPGNGPAARARAEALQNEVDTKTATLAALKADLQETRAETTRILQDAPRAPLAANPVMTDPFGGVSMLAIALLVLLFAIIVMVAF